MILTVRQVLQDAMSLAGAVDTDEELQGSDLEIALRAANVMLNKWSSTRLMMRSTTQDILTLTGGKYIYNISAQATAPDFVTAKPFRIKSSFVRDASNTDMPVDIITLTEYEGYGDKSITIGTSRSLYYDPGPSQQVINTGIIYLYPIPDQNYRLFIESDKYLTEFVNYTDVITFEPLYYEALTYNLALRLFRRFHEPTAQIPPDIIKIAQDAIKAIETMNSVQARCGIDLPGKSSNYNILSDTWN